VREQQAGEQDGQKLRNKNQQGFQKGFHQWFKFKRGFKQGRCKSMGLKYLPCGLYGGKQQRAVRADAVRDQ
jgi:hypothetical protein